MTDILFLLRAEVILTGLILLLLLLKLADIGLPNTTVIHVAQGGLLLLLVTGFVLRQEGTAFGDMFTTQSLLRWQKNILTLGALLLSLQAYSWVHRHKHALEFYLLLLTSLLGMYFMLSAGNLLMLYLGLEMSTLPLIALANFDLEKKQSSEAAFKMVVSSAFASALLLFGISWLYGATGSIGYAALGAGMQGNSLQLMAVVFVVAGFGFKISAVPFHLWTADVYEGAPLPVTAFLSTISKGAVLFALVAVVQQVFPAVQGEVQQLLALLAAGTMLVGNLFALRQTQLKRFLAFSSIAQVGFILVAMSTTSVAGYTATMYFILIYLFSNLAAFGVVTLLSEATGKEAIGDYAGLHSTHPTLAWVLAIALFSLAGIPPMAGFFGKFFLLLAGAGGGAWWLVIFAAVNMVIAMAYYLRVVRVMFMQSPVVPLPAMAGHWMPRAALAICTAGVLLTGILSGSYHYIAALLQP